MVFSLPKNRPDTVHDSSAQAIEPIWTVPVHVWEFKSESVLVVTCTHLFFSELLILTRFRRINWSLDS
jgi:hypothetical protein